MSERDRDGEAPAAPAPAEPEEPQTSVHEQPIQPDREDDAETERHGG